MALMLVPTSRRRLLIPAEYLAFRHQRFRHTIHGLKVFDTNALVGRVQTRQGGDVGGCDPQDAQLGEPLTVREGRDCSSEGLKGGADGVDPRPFPCVGLHPPFSRHVLVVGSRTRRPGG